MCGALEIHIKLQIRKPQEVTAGMFISPLDVASEMYFKDFAFGEKQSTNHELGTLHIFCQIFLSTI